MDCPACGSVIKEVPAGVSKKTGRPYEAFQVCSNPVCSWKPGANKILVESRLPSKIPHQEPTNDVRERSMMMAYAKDIVVALIQGGSIPQQPVKEVIVYYRELWQEFKNPNSVKLE